MALEGTFRSYFGAVAVPILDKGDGTISNVTHDWANSTAALGGGLAVTVLRLQIRNYRVDIAKERLAEMAIANHCDWVFFLDDDVVCPPDTLLKMTRLWRSDPKYKVISGVYWSKSSPPVPLVFKGNLEGSFWDWTTQELITADGAGAGCLFVDTSVLKKMSKPWFSNNYFFEDPKTEYDLQRWDLTDRLGQEFSKGEAADPNAIKLIENDLRNLSKKIQASVDKNAFDPALLKNKHADAQTTEDLYFFKKVKEELGLDLWVDCSIQCQHQDKRTGQVWGIAGDMPQAQPRYAGRLMERDKKVVLDIGCGDSNYYIKEGTPIRIDMDPKVKPDICCDARWLPLEDCFADMVLSSHLLEHFSFKETLSVLKEWIRVLKIGGKLITIVPNLRWASKRILNPPEAEWERERTMFMYFSAQKGDLREAYTDIHKAGFTPQSMREIMEKLGVLDNIEIHTSDGNYGNWDDPQLLSKDDDGYNIVAIATKKKHQASISLKSPLKVQEESMLNIGEKAVWEKKPEEKSASVVEQPKTAKKHAHKV